MKIKSIHHLKLTVSDLKRSAEFYAKLPGFKQVADYPNFVMFGVGDFNLGLTDHADKLQNKEFSEFNVGLDHVAFQLDSRESLLEIKDWLVSESIDHGEIIELSNGVVVIAFRDPDNIQLEFCFDARK